MGESVSGKQIAICVLGAPRSGGSLVTAMLASAGAQRGPEEGLRNLSEKALRTWNGNWSEPPAMPIGWEHWALLSGLRGEAQALLSEAPADGPWVWGDPRCSFTLPFWQELLPAMRYVVCLHDPAGVARALERHDEAPSKRAPDLWLAYTCAALSATCSHPRLVVVHEDLQNNPWAIAGRLSAFVDRPEAFRDRPARDLLAQAIADSPPEPDDPVTEADSVPEKIAAVHRIVQRHLIGAPHA